MENNGTSTRRSEFHDLTLQFHSLPKVGTSTFQPSSIVVLVVLGAHNHSEFSEIYVRVSVFSS